MKGKTDLKYLIDQYRKLHEEKYYGDSSTMYLDLITPLVKAFDPPSILDYGCGRSSLVNHYYNWGKTKIYKYDPAVPEYECFPDIKNVGMVLCTDVLEHILWDDVYGIIKRIKSLTDLAIFVISLKPSRATLPDGRNAHVSIKESKEWLRVIKLQFPKSIIYKILYWENKDKKEPASIIIKTW